jgi:hypothetical protein
LGRLFRAAVSVAGAEVVAVALAVGWEVVSVPLDVAAAFVVAAAAVVEVAAPGPGSLGRFAGVFCAATLEISKMETSSSGRESAWSLHGNRISNVLS